jgi:hypothetical protein
MKSLPLTPLETYLLAEDVPAHPCWQVGRTLWRGSFRRDALEAAWAEATGRHPLLGARVVRGPLGGLRWDLDAKVPLPVHWSRAEAGEWPEWQTLDLGRGPGARLYAVEGDGRTAVIACVHHAVCDGIAVGEVMDEMFVAYAGLLGEPRTPRPAPLEAALRRRGQMGSTVLERLWIPLVQALGMVAEAKLLRRKVAPLVPHEPAPDSAARSPGWPAVVEWTADEPLSERVRAAAKRERATLPELVMRDVQAAVGAWREAQGAAHPEDWTRLGFAVGVGKTAPGARPVANQFGIAIIDRQQRSLANRPRLLRRAKEDMALVERWRLGYSLWVLLALRRLTPGGIRAYARKRVVRTTFTLSFMGIPFARSPLRREGRFPAVPGAVMETVQGFAPTRPGTCATMDVGMVFGRLSACLAYDPRVIDPARAQALMGAFVAELSKSAEGEPAA